MDYETGEEIDISKAHTSFLRGGIGFVEIDGVLRTVQEEGAKTASSSQPDALEGQTGQSPDVRVLSVVWGGQKRIRCSSMFWTRWSTSASTSRR